MARCSFLRWWLVVAALAWQAVTPAAAATRLTQAQMVAEAGERFPEAAAPTLLTLPHTWDDGSAAGTRWYRLTLPRAAGDAPQALHIARACRELQVLLNGQVLWTGGTQSLCHRPLLLPLPAALMQAEVNRLDLRVRGEPLAQVGSRTQAGGLSEVEIGPQAELAQRHARALLLESELPQALAVALALMGGFLFVLGWRHRDQSHLAYFGAMSLGWALVEARRWLPPMPMEESVVEFLHGALLAFVTFAAVQFLLRDLRWRNPLVTRLLALQCALMPLTLVLAGPSNLHVAMAVWVALFAAEALVAVLFHLQLQRRRQGQVSPRALLGLGLLVVAVALRIIARHLELSPLLPLLAQLLIPVVLLVVGLRLVRRHGRALQAAEATRVNLEARIRDATAEIERNFRQMTELRVEQVTERERKRIAADLHDDLGAKLLTIVHTSEDPKISTLAREALEEMRLSVRGLTGKPVPLANALGDWRAELMSRLTQSGIEADWESPEDLPQTLSARAYVQTTRILRESTSNIIKHSGASKCSFTCGISDGDLQLVIQDNGNGIPMELDGRLDRGHGMASMKQRAKQMQGQCLVESGPGFGTVIRLTLPLDRATQPAP
jgi:two-component system, NarL family, sensor histidine kinase UhpB